MSNLLAMLEPLIAQVLIDGLTTRPAQPKGFKKTGWGLLALSALFGALGVIYLIIAMNAYLGTLYSPEFAALTTGVAALMLSAVSGLSYVLIKRMRRKVVQKQAVQSSNTVIDLIMSATEGLEEPIAQNPRTSVFLASLAGYMAGNKMH